MKTAYHVRRCPDSPGSFEVFYRRVKDPDSRLVMFADDSLEEDLWPIHPLIRNSQNEAQQVALDFLEQVSRWEIDHLFERRPRPVPIHKLRVGAVEHPDRKLSAVIYRHDPARYEVRCFGDIEGCDYEEGWRLNIIPNADEVVPEFHCVLVFANSLESAQEAGRTEMQRIVGAGSPRIKRR